jgi:hypothetical protein
LVAAVVIAAGIFVYQKIENDFTALGTKQAVQTESLRKLGIERDYLIDSIENFGNDRLTSRLNDLDGSLSVGPRIMSVRFLAGSLEVTLFVTDDEMKDNAVAELESNYTVDACIFEKEVKEQNSGVVFRQYNLVLRYPE